MFGASFLPTPPHLEEFAKEVKSRFFKVDSAAKRRNQLKMLDTVDLISNMLKTSDWSVEEQEEYLKEVATIELWDKPEVWDDLKDAQSALEGIEDSLDSADAEERVTDALKKAHGIPSESELEDAYHAADSIQFTGSPKQIAWAESIATKNAEAIAKSRITFEKLPTEAKWWIENRDSILSALKNFKAAK